MFFSEFTRLPPRSTLTDTLVPYTTLCRSHTCPMHPESVQDGPGTCPICGMAREPEMPSLDDGENPELTVFRRRFWWTLPLSFVVMMLAMFGHHQIGRASCRERVCQYV